MNRLKTDNMRLFRRKPVIFITVLDEIRKVCLGYPKHLPLPRIMDTVIFEDSIGKVSGQVRSVKHITVGNVTDIKIILD